MRYIINEKYRHSVDELSHIIKTMILGFVLGAGFSVILFTTIHPLNSTKPFILYMVYFGLIFCGVPYAWLMLPDIYIGILGPINWILFFVKLFIAMVAGLVITPICLIARIVQIVFYGIRLRRPKSFRLENNYTA